MLELFFSAFGAGLCAALIILTVKEFYHFIAARVFAFLMFGGLVFLCHNWLPDSLSTYAYMIESATPAFFWTSCRLIFHEGSALPRLGLFISIYSFTMPVVKHFMMMYLGMTPDWLHFIGRELTQYCEYILVIMGIFSLLKGQGDDLVESRRRLRWAIMGASGLSLGWAVFSFNLHWGSDLSRILAVDVSIAIIIWSLFKGRQDIWGRVSLRELEEALQGAALKPADETSKAVMGVPYNAIDTSLNNDGLENAGDNDRSLALSVEQSAVDSAFMHVDQQNPRILQGRLESETLQQVKVMMTEGFYRRENLTLKDLSIALNTPEYKVRAVINKEMGYRNFNEFINEYRIREAAQRLLSEPETPISNIALDVGYRTLSSFNRAFRKQKDTTPTAFREV